MSQRRNVEFLSTCHLNEMPHLPLHVEGDVCRIVMDAPYSADSESSRTNAELRKAWIKEHCAGSAVPNIYWNPVTKQEVMDVRFSTEDLALYQRTFELADGHSAVPGEHCLLMRHADYVADVRRLAHARWGTDQPALVQFPQLSYKLGEETQRASQKAHWQLLCRLRHISAQWTQSADLTAEEIQTLAQLNARLMQVEQWCLDEVATIHRKNGPKATPPLFPTGYFRLTDIWVEVAFALKDGDPEYDDSSDNFFWQLDRPVHGMQFDRARRWNEPPEENNEGGNSNGPQGGYLFDKLRQHLGLDWRDMLRVGDVHVDVRYRGTRVSPSLSTSDSMAYTPVSPYLWRDEARAPHLHRNHLSCFANEDGLDPLDDDAAVDGWTRDLSADEMAHCERMNAELESITFHIDGTTRAIGTPLEKRVADPQDPLDDYELNAFNDYWLHPQDAVALARGDRLLVRQDYSILKRTGDRLYFDHETDWAEGIVSDQFAFRHCYAFHDLYDHHHISFKDVPRIDRVCTKVDVWLQRRFIDEVSIETREPKSPVTDTDVKFSADEVDTIVSSRKPKLQSLKQPLAELLNHIQDKAEHRSDMVGISTGLIDLDRVTKGLTPGSLFVLAARPSMGKNVLALNIAKHIGLIERLPVAIFAMDMSASQLAQRMVSAVGEFVLSDLQSGNLSSEDWQRLPETIDQLIASSIYVDDTQKPTITELCSSAQQIARQCGQLGLIIVDSLQQIDGFSRDGKAGFNKYDEVLLHLKNLAMELRCPIIALSTLRRRAQISETPLLMVDLHQSGVNETLTDVVFFVERDEYYTGDRCKEPGVAQIIIGKNRNGPTGFVKCVYRASWFQFETLGGIVPAGI